MPGWLPPLLICCLSVFPAMGAAQGTERVIGGDTLRSGDIGSALEATRDVFAVGATVSLSGTIAQDGHAAGFDVDVDAATGDDLYAAGVSVGLRGPVGGDLTATGFSVRTGPEATVGGNARLAGGRIMIESPVRGALSAAGGRVTLNADIAGDVLLAGETLNFGPAARIGGTLIYSAPRQIEIPERVLSADRVIFQAYQRSKIMEDARDMWADWESPVVPDAWTLIGGFLVTLGFFVLIGALFLVLAPAQVRHLRRTVSERPGMALLSGVIGLSVLLGLVPIAALTVVGIPLVPVVILGIVVIWILGYILGGYVLAMRAMRGLGAAKQPATWQRLLALVIGLTAMALLNFIPVLGWMANFALVLLGIGGMTTALCRRSSIALDPVTDVNAHAATKFSKEGGIGK